MRAMRSTPQPAIAASSSTVARGLRRATTPSTRATSTGSAPSGDADADAAGRSLVAATPTSAASLSSPPPLAHSSTASGVGSSPAPSGGIASGSAKRVSPRPRAAGSGKRCSCVPVASSGHLTTRERCALGEKPAGSCSDRTSSSSCPGCGGAADGAAGGGRCAEGEAVLLLGADEAPEADAEAVCTHLAPRFFLGLGLKSPRWCASPVLPWWPLSARTAHHATASSSSSSSTLPAAGKPAQWDASLSEPESEPEPEPRGLAERGGRIADRERGRPAVPAGMPTTMSCATAGTCAVCKEGRNQAGDVAGRKRTKQRMLKEGKEPSRECCRKEENQAGNVERRKRTNAA
eukprot:365949-Chlamydomonas_euryale.AAC.1